MVFLKHCYLFVKPGLCFAAGVISFAALSHKTWFVVSSVQCRSNTLTSVVRDRVNVLLRRLSVISILLTYAIMPLYFDFTGLRNYLIDANKRQVSKKLCSVSHTNQNKRRLLIKATSQNKALIRNLWWPIAAIVKIEKILKTKMK